MVLMRQHARPVYVSMDFWSLLSDRSFSNCMMVFKAKDKACTFHVFTFKYVINNNQLHNDSHREICSQVFFCTAKAQTASLRFKDKQTFGYFV